MAVDLKYGKVMLEKGTIGEHEPVVVFRAQDKLLPKVLANYHLLCLEAGSPDNHLNGVIKSLRDIEHWQRNNKTEVPTSKGYNQ